jgi:hypothetical protein
LIFINVCFLPTHLADANERNPFVAVVAGDAACIWVQHGLAVHKKKILVESMRQFHSCDPVAVRQAAHWISPGPPFIEIPDEADLPRARRVAEKVNVMTGSRRGAKRSGRIPICVLILDIHILISMLVFLFGCASILQNVWMNFPRCFLIRSTFRSRGFGGSVYPMMEHESRVRIPAFMVSFRSGGFVVPHQTKSH